MQVINILGDYMHIKVIFKIGDQLMGCIWLCFQNVFTAGIIKALYQLWVFGPGFGCGDFFYTMLFPKSITVTKSINATFGAHACTGKDHQLFHYSVS